MFHKQINAKPFLASFFDGNLSVYHVSHEFETFSKKGSRFSDIKRECMCSSHSDSFNNVDMIITNLFIT